MRQAVQARKGPSAQATHRLVGGGIGALALLMLLQALGLVAGQRPWTAAWWQAVFLWMLLAVFVCLVAAGVRGRCRRSVDVGLAALLSAGLALWPVASPSHVPPGIGSPWLWAAMDVGAAWCAFSGGTVLGSLYSAGTGVAFSVVRTAPDVGSKTALTALEDTAFAAVLAFIICLGIGTLRRSAARVDEAAGRALGLYSDAASARALGSERLRLDGLLHDGVMTALITAAKADSPYECAASSRLAQEALERLQCPDASAESPPAPVPELAARIRFTVEGSVKGPKARVTCDSPADVMLPAPVVSALFEATTEAVRNAARHSRAARCSVDIIGRSGTGISRAVVRIEDDGDGFDQALVSDRRLGIRISILGRIDAVGGAARVVSAPGAGTVVHLEWEGAAP